MIENNRLRPNQLAGHSRCFYLQIAAESQQQRIYDNHPESDERPEEEKHQRSVDSHSGGTEEHDATAPLKGTGQDVDDRNSEQLDGKAEPNSFQDGSGLGGDVLSLDALDKINEAPAMETSCEDLDDAADQDDEARGFHGAEL